MKDLIPFRLDRDSGGTTLCVRENIPAKLLNTEKLPILCRIKFKEANMVNKLYHPQKTSIDQHIEALSKSIDLDSSIYKDLFFRRFK